VAHLAQGTAAMPRPRKPAKPIASGPSKASKKAVADALKALDSIGLPTIAAEANVGLSTVYAWRNPAARQAPGSDRLLDLARAFRAAGERLSRAADHLELICKDQA
jgi:hypothetical protein